MSAEVLNLVDGQARSAVSGAWLEKLRPADGSLLRRMARSDAADVDAAVGAARAAWKYVNLISDPAKA